MSADEVAESGFMALEQGRAVHIPGRGNKVIAGLAKLLPESIALSLMNKNSDRVRKGHK